MKLLFSNVNETSMTSSDNSTDSSEGSPTGAGGTGGQFEGPNLELERLLPSAVSDCGGSTISDLPQRALVGHCAVQLEIESHFGS